MTLDENFQPDVKTDELVEPLSDAVLLSEEPETVEGLNDLNSEFEVRHELSSESAELASPEVDWNKVKIDKENFEIQKESLNAKILERESQIREFAAKTSDLLNWSEEHQKSFLWRSLTKMESELDSVNGTLERYSSFVNSFEQPEIGTLANARKKFHRNILRALTAISAIAGFFWYLPSIIASLSQISYLRDLSNWTSYPTRGTILTYAISFFLVLLIIELIRYYNVWSAFSRRVTLILWKLDLVTRNTDHCRGEKSRLEGLYPQVKDWLEILGNSLNHPWKIREEWLSATPKDLSLDRSPFSLSFAQAMEDEPSAAHALRRKAIEGHLRRGWREAVFIEQVAAVRKSLGLPEDRLNVDALDRDITFSPGGPRSQVKRLLSEDSQLYSVAKTQIIPLMQRVQTEFITEARPPVQEMRSNPLKELLEDDYGLSDDESTSWDHFLSLAIADEKKARTPLSIFTFSSSGRQVGHADRAETIYLCPERLVSKIPIGSAMSRSYSAKLRLPLDIVVRIDITGPVSRDDLLISTQSQTEREESISQYQEEMKTKQQGWRSGT